MGLEKVASDGAGKKHGAERGDVADAHEQSS
jgi:hypothetical protein